MKFHLCVFGGLIVGILTTMGLFSSFAQNTPASQANASIAEAARKQIGVTTSYDPKYVALSYPNGDVATDRGVCTDVVIRALRQHGIDLQKLVHEDMKNHFSAYPKNWGLTKTDRNIDHRRVPNLMTFFTRNALKLPVSTDGSKFLPGDFVTCTVAGKLPHIMIVSERKGASGHPMIIHNIGSGTQEEDRLFEFPLTGHYRWKDTLKHSSADATTPRP